MDEMIAKFEITDIHKSGAVLDPIKLDWMNSEYIKRLPLSELHERLAEHLKRYEPDFYEHTFAKQDFTFNTKILTEIQARMKRFNEFIDLTKFFYSNADIRTDLLINLKMKIETLDFARESLELAQRILMNSCDFSSIEGIKDPLIEAIAKAELKNGQVLWPLRVALS